MRPRSISEHWSTTEIPSSTYLSKTVSYAYLFTFQIINNALSSLTLCILSQVRVPIFFWLTIAINFGYAYQQWHENCNYSSSGSALLKPQRQIYPLQSTEWKSIISACMVMCLGQGADLQMAQLMPLPVTISCSSKSSLFLPFWCWLTWVVPDKIKEGHKTVARVCVFPTILR